MNIRQSLDLILILAAIFTTTGAFFLVRSIIQTGAKEIAAMAGTYVGSNPHLQSSLVQQKADTLIGFFFTLLGGAFSFLSVLISFEFTIKVSTLIFVLLGWTAIFGCAFYAAKVFRKRLQLKTDAIAFAHHLESYLRNGQVNVPKLFEDAKKYGLADFVKGESCPFQAVAKVLRFAGANPGADYIISLKSSSP